MKLSKSILKNMKIFAQEEWLARGKRDEDAFVSECWIIGLQRALAKEKLELYVFDTNYNNDKDPKLFLDISGKLEI